MAEPIQTGGEEKITAPTIPLGFVSVFLILLLAVIGMVWIGLRARSASGFIVTAARDIPAYTLIQDIDLATQVAFPEPEMVVDPAQVIGKFSVGAVSKGAPLMRDELVQPALPLDDLRLLAVPFTSPVIPQPGELVSLVGFQEGELQPVYEYDGAEVLGSADQTLILALPKDQAALAARFWQEKTRLVVLRQVAP